MCASQIFQQVESVESLTVPFVKRTVCCERRSHSSEAEVGLRPFSIVTSSGDKYPSRIPEFIFLTQRAVIVADDLGYTVNLDSLHIVGIEDIPAPAKGTVKTGIES